MRVCTATACFAARGGRHLGEAEEALGVVVGHVDAAGRTVAACVTPAEPGMAVDTVGEEVSELRRDAVALIASALPPRARRRLAHRTGRKLP
ncbi:hypothetical protein ABTX77_28985 [Streptomyces sp. NPDC097704]|uniref:hypothetical protein n=1 Tax=Streptomyces sp. NPDC097704 TaxID=3157101 RepID=UPI003328449D